MQLLIKAKVRLSFVVIHFFQFNDVGLVLYLFSALLLVEFELFSLLQYNPACFIFYFDSFVCPLSPLIQTKAKRFFNFPLAFFVIFLYTLLICYRFLHILLYFNSTFILFTHTIFLSSLLHPHTLVNLISNFQLYNHNYFHIEYPFQDLFTF